VARCTTSRTARVAASYSRRLTGQGRLTSQG